MGRAWRLRPDFEPPAEVLDDQGVLELREAFIDGTFSAAKKQVLA